MLPLCGGVWASGRPSSRRSGLDWELGMALQQGSCRLEEKRNFPLESGEKPSPSSYMLHRLPSDASHLAFGPQPIPHATAAAVEGAQYDAPEPRALFGAG